MDKYPKMLNTRFFGAGQDGLCASLIENNDHVIKFLLQRGANPNQYTGWYELTLHRAENMLINKIYKDENKNDKDKKSAEIIRNSEFAILLIKSAKFSVKVTDEICDTIPKIVSQKAMISLSSDMQIELASYFW